MYNPKIRFACDRTPSENEFLPLFENRKFGKYHPIRKPKNEPATAWTDSGTIYGNLFAFWSDPATVWDDLRLLMCILYWSGEPVGRCRKEGCRPCHEKKWIVMKCPHRRLEKQRWQWTKATEWLYKCPRRLSQSHRPIKRRKTTEWTYKCPRRLCLNHTGHLSGEKNNWIHIQMLKATVSITPAT